MRRAPVRGEVPVFILVGGLLFGCGGLPSDFESLPLEEKVAAYEKHFWRGGLPLMEARAHISWHGHDSADLMVSYLEDDGRGIPPREALQIIDQVQLRGCDLKGTAAQSAIEKLLLDESLPSDFRIAAEVALNSIRDGVHLEPGRLSTVTGGPCEQARE